MFCLYEVMRCYRVLPATYVIIGWQVWNDDLEFLRVQNSKSQLNLIDNFALHNHL